MTEPSTTLHYAPNGNWNGNTFAPGAVGFNLADVESPSELPFVPTGDKALVYMGGSITGATSAFITAITPYLGNSQVYGFYLADSSGSATTLVQRKAEALKLKAESDWIHTHDPGAKTFMAEENLSAPLTPQYYYTPANTHIDLFGLDAYPAQTSVPNNFDLNVINLAVKKAEAIGIPQKDLVPIYQAFGGGLYASYILPTATQEGQILSRSGSLLPNPAFDFAYSWGDQYGDTAISDQTALQSVFAAHNGVTLRAGSSAAPAANGAVAENEFASIIGLLGTGSNMGFNSASSESQAHEHMLSALNVAPAHGLKGTGVVHYGVGHGSGS
jgi:hypothetical protein